MKEQPKEFVMDRMIGRILDYYNFNDVDVDLGLDMLKFIDSIQIDDFSSSLDYLIKITKHDESNSETLRLCHNLFVVYHKYRLEMLEIPTKNVKMDFPVGDKLIDIKDLERFYQYFKSTEVYPKTHRFLCAADITTIYIENAYFLNLNIDEERQKEPQPEVFVI